MTKSLIIHSYVMKSMLYVISCEWQKRSYTEPESKDLQIKLTIINFLHIHPIYPPSGDYPNYSDVIAVPTALPNNGKKSKEHSCIKFGDKFRRKHSEMSASSEEKGSSNPFCK